MDWITWAPQPSGFSLDSSIEKHWKEIGGWKETEAGYLFPSFPVGSQFEPQLSSLTFSYSSCQNPLQAPVAKPPPSTPQA